MISREVSDRELLFRRSRCRLEQLDRIAIGIFDLDLPAVLEPPDRAARIFPQVLLSRPAHPQACGLADWRTADQRSPVTTASAIAPRPGTNNQRLQPSAAGAIMTRCA